MELLRFLFSRLFLRNLLLAAAITFVVGLFIFLSLRIYTRHGQAMAVPDVRGLTLEETAQLITEKKLRYKIIDSTHNSSVEKGCVVEQNPPPEFRVKKNRTIFITINAFNPETVRMPDLVGVTLRQAKVIIENAGLKLGRLTYVPDIAINNVLQQKYKGMNIEAGDSIIKGSIIDLILGRGLSNDKTVTPDLIGLYLSEAEDRITSRYLNVGAVIYDGSIFTAEDSAIAFVWKQKPAYDENKELINLGASVDIWVTVDSLKLPQADTVTVEIP